jgi:hypothetical protein
MAVVINEFEVVPEGPRPAAPTGEPQGTTLASAPDLLRALQRAHERAMRVRAY